MMLSFMEKGRASGVLGKGPSPLNLARATAFCCWDGRCCCARASWKLARSTPRASHGSEQASMTRSSDMRRPQRQTIDHLTDQFDWMLHFCSQENRLRFSYALQHAVLTRPFFWACSTATDGARETSRQIGRSHLTVAQCWFVLTAS